AGDHDLIVSGPGETSGYRVSLDGAVVIDAWDWQPARAPWRRVSLTAAPHRLVIEKQQRRHQDGFRFSLGLTPVDDVVSTEAKVIAAKADVVVVAAGFDPDSESEGSDRTFALPA